MSSRQLLASLATVALMALFGYGVWAVLGTLQSRANHVVDPVQSQALLALPGTIYLAQGGSLYSLQGLHFTRLNTPPGDWAQVAPAPGGDLLAVDKGNGYSDLYLLSPGGQVIRTLLQESSPNYFDNHFVYYPRVSPNGQSLFYAWYWIDPYANYNVDFEILSAPLSNPRAGPTVWSLSNLYYQGGDVEPLPLANGALIYVKYATDTSTGAVYSQLAYVTSPGAEPQYLTTPAQNCSEPAVNPQGTEIAMICSNNQLQTSTLDVASWNGTTLGPLVQLSPGPMAAMPTWAPNGESLVFMNVPERALPFQLYWVPKAGTIKPGAPQQVTQDLSLTATSAPVWYP
jgi:Tol biopolymer transport system component